MYIHIQLLQKKQQLGAAAYRDQIVIVTPGMIVRIQDRLLLEIASLSNTLLVRIHWAP
jgi:hypothetical protein